MINRAKLQHILEYAKQQRHIGLHCKVPPEYMVEIVEMAMLQGAEPVSNRDELTDGWVACSERMPEESGRYWCYVEEQNDLGKSHYQWNCAWNGKRWWVEHEDGGRVTHWMPLPAAPQQEAE
ncbi:DUF551 domain-containing protein [Enterobacter hormaechei]|nr:DUF551 domain-containing protein [Enterobacter hormaechei]